VRKTETTPKKRSKAGLYILLAVLWLLVLLLFGRELLPRILTAGEQETAPATTVETQPIPTQTTQPPLLWETGLVSSVAARVDCTDAAGEVLGTLSRGAQIQYAVTPEGETVVRVNGREGYLPEDVQIVSDMTECVPAHTLYVRTGVNLRDAEGRLLETFLEKGQAVEVTGCDAVEKDGQINLYRVNFGGAEGYVMPWYLTDSQTHAAAVYDDGKYATHADRGDRYGGGGAADLDYFPREKGQIPGNEMPEECRTLYIASWCIENIDQYLAIAESSGINAFVVDIVDGGAVGYAHRVMQTYCPSAAAAASNTVEQYQAAIEKLKDAGYYVIGRIATFNDSYFVSDHPEYAITDPEGKPLKLSGEYWPSPYQRAVWQYKVDLAVEAVTLMGFHEIQFDYVRFPDRTSRYEDAGTIDFHNTYGETKAQAIQRFLMYATDILHQHGAYVSADVYGESAFAYVTAYGQYWPAISNVVDAISGMPYPDHFGAVGNWRPWEHPYDMLKSWGDSVMSRQSETATPAVVRTWIQAYNAIRKPYNTYGPDEVFAQIKGLRDAGCTGGYMTWNAGSSVEKYTTLIPAFTPPETEIPETTEATVPETTGATVPETTGETVPGTTQAAP